MKEKGIIEGYEMKRRVIVSACETAQTILKCDGLVKCKLRERHRHWIKNFCFICIKSALISRPMLFNNGQFPL